jgi:hypothetical protein
MAVEVPCAGTASWAASPRPSLPRATVHVLTVVANGAANLGPHTLGIGRAPAG